MLFHVIGREKENTIASETTNAKRLPMFEVLTLHTQPDHSRV